MPFFTLRVAARVLTKPEKAQTMLRNLQRVACAFSFKISASSGRCARAAQKRIRSARSERAGYEAGGKSKPCLKTISCPERKVNHERDNQDKQSSGTAGEDVPAVEPGQLRRRAGRANYHHPKHSQGLRTRYGLQDLEAEGRLEARTEYRE